MHMNRVSYICLAFNANIQGGENGSFMAANLHSVQWTLALRTLERIGLGQSAILHSREQTRYERAALDVLERNDRG